MIEYSRTERGDILRMTKSTPDRRQGFLAGDLVRVKERTSQGVLVESGNGTEVEFVFTCGAAYLEPTEWKNDFPVEASPATSQQAAPAPKGVTEGRVIHYIPRREELVEARRPPEGAAPPHIAGVIVRVWDAARGYINATIFPDGGNDGLNDTAELTAWRTSIEYDGTATKPGSWHFPEPV